MQKRMPVVAGQFYPANPDRCRAEIEQYITQRPVRQSLPDRIVAAIVPHAGWIFSGSTAATAFNAVKKCHPNIDTFVIFGAAHGYFDKLPALYDCGQWQTPLGDIDIDENLAQSVLQTKTTNADTNSHRLEHSIEVQVPFIQHLFPQAKILPVLVPPNRSAIDLGRSIGELIDASDRKIICLGSTDLTHYGPRYGFEPMGTGPQAIKWAHEVNDRHFINLAVKLQPEQLLNNAAEHSNACGPGAAAAAVAVAKNLDVSQGLLLVHTNSSEIMQAQMATTSAESVGYASIIF